LTAAWRETDVNEQHLSDLATERYCYLTTTGRRSGRPREIEIWFHLEGRTIYMLAEGRGRANWVRNLIADPSVSVRIADQAFGGTARVVEDAEEELIARRALPAKYKDSYSDDLTEWGETALPVAVDLEA
jgi:deazaflavin-dependent oxidoreductase (nitroreductase family)